MGRKRDKKRREMRNWKEGGEEERGRRWMKGRK